MSYLARRGRRGGGRRGRGYRRGDSRGYRRGRRGGQSYYMNNESKRHLEGLDVCEFLTNFLPLDLGRVVLYQYTAKFPKLFRFANKNAERSICYLLKSKILETLDTYDSDLVFEGNIIFSTKMVGEFKKLRVKLEIVKNHCAIDKNFLDSSTSGSEEESGEDEFENDYLKAKDIVSVEVYFETAKLEDSENETRLAGALTALFKNFLKNHPVLSRTYVFEGDRFYEKKPFKSSKEEIHRSIEDHYMEKEIHKAFKILLTKRQGGWFLVVKPSYKIKKIHPNGLKMIDLMMDYNWNNDEIRNMYRKFKIFSLYHRFDRNRPEIVDVDFRRKPTSQVDFTEKKMSYLDYIYMNSKYRRMLEKEYGKRKSDVIPNQPTLIVERDGKHETYIPELVDVYCGIADENQYKQQFVSSATNKGGLKQELDRVVETMELLEKMKLGEAFQEFGVRIDFSKRLEKVQRKMVRSVRIADAVEHKVFHHTDEKADWKRKMRSLVLKDKACGKRIEFNYIMLLVHESSKRVAQEVFNEIIIACQDNDIDFKQEMLLECYYKDDLSVWKKHVDRFKRRLKRLPKILVVITPTYRSDPVLYSEIVSFCGENGIIEQFCRGETAKKFYGRPNIIGPNLFRQIYCKLGGSLWSVDFTSRAYFEKESETIIFGISTLKQHQKKYTTMKKFENKDGELKVRRFTKIYPTIFCVVASCPKKEWSRRCTFLLPFEEQEISGTAVRCGLDYVLGEFKEEFKDSKVGKILIFRGGIGDSKFHKCEKLEVRTAKKLCLRHGISLVFCVVQKRLNCILFNSTAGNPPCGSYVDEKVVFSDSVRKSFLINLDFFFVSCESDIHVTRPCHFVQLHDDVKNDFDFVQLCYEACNLYFNFPGSIKLPFTLQLAERLGKKCYDSIFRVEKRERRRKIEELDDSDPLKLKLKFYCINSFKDNSKIEKNLEYDGDDYERESLVRVIFHEKTNEGMFEL